MRRFVFLFAILGAALLSAKSHNMILNRPALVGATELKAGEYKIEVVDQKVVIRKGNVRAENPVTIENAAAPFENTTVIFKLDGDKAQIKEVRLGGSTTKLLFQ